jgi:hypothetical protein
MSLSVKEALGIPRDHIFRIMRFEASTGLTEDEIEKVVHKIDRRRKKEPNNQICVVIDSFN